jgi:hypothetical protein
MNDKKPLEQLFEQTDPQIIFSVFSELMEVLAVINPRLYNEVLARLGK